MKISELVTTYRHQNNYSLQDFADALMEAFPGETLSRQAVSEWEQGTSKPKYFFLLAIMLTYQDHGNDWRHNWALETLQLLKPELYQPDKTKGN